jgi:hypothetical protein
VHVQRVSLRLLDISANAGVDARATQSALLDMPELRLVRVVTGTRGTRTEPGVDDDAAATAMTLKKSKK